MASLAILETVAIGWDEEPQKRTEKKCVVSSLCFLIVPFCLLSWQKPSCFVNLFRLRCASRIALAFDL